MRAARRQLAWSWVGLGLIGSLALSVAGSQLERGRPIAWWFHVDIGSGRFASVVFWGGVAALCIAWLGLGHSLRSGWCGVGRLLAIGALWALPAALGPVLFSHDMYAYLAQGELLRLGLDPYHHAPAALLARHRTDVFDAVSPFWRHTTAPYGPLFLWLVAGIAAIAGHNLVVAILLLRVLELAGLALLAVFVPRLARALGADERFAVWLAVISPLALVELVAAGHNDALGAGLLVLGAWLAVRRRPVWAIAVCAVATTVKLPAAVGIVVIATCSTRDARGLIGSVWVAARALGAVVVVFAAVGVITGVELHWITGSLLSTPGRVKLAITPSSAIGWSVHSLLHTLHLAPGGHHSERSTERVFGDLALLASAAAALVLCWRVRYERLVRCLGLLLLVSAIGGSAAWPWYLTWGIALLAAYPGAQRRAAARAALIAPSVVLVFVISADGQVRISLPYAPYVVAAYALALCAWWVSRRRGAEARRLPGALSWAQVGARRVVR